jgi:hypothetical protein
VRIADSAGVGRLGLFHHDPSHSDDKVRSIELAAQRLRPNSFACREGQTLVIASSAELAATAASTGLDHPSAQRAAA